MDKALRLSSAALINYLVKFAAQSKALWIGARKYWVREVSKRDFSAGESSWVGVAERHEGSGGFKPFGAYSFEKAEKAGSTGGAQKRYSCDVIRNALVQKFGEPVLPSLMDPRFQKAPFNLQEVFQSGQPVSERVLKFICFRAAEIQMYLSMQRILERFVTETIDSNGTGDPNVKAACKQKFSEGANRYWDRLHGIEEEEQPIEQRDVVGGRELGEVSRATFLQDLAQLAEQSFNQAGIRSFTLEGIKTGFVRYNNREVEQAERGAKELIAKIKLGKASEVELQNFL